MKSRSLSRVVVVAATLLGASAPLFVAEEACAADAADEKLAQTRLTQGKAAYKKKKYEPARRALRDAYQLNPTDETALYLGLASVKTKKYGDGAKYLKKYLAATQGTSSPEHDEAEAALAEALKKLGTIVIEAPRGTEVTIDGDPDSTVTTPTDPVVVEPGAHTVRGRTADGASLSQEVKVKAGEKATARLGDPNSGPEEKTAIVDDTPQEEKKEEKKPSGPGLFAPPKTMVPVVVALGVTAIGGIGILVFGLSRNNAQGAANQVELSIRDHASKGAPEGGGLGHAPFADAGGVCAAPDPTLRRIYGQACDRLQSTRDAVDRNALLTNISIGVAGVGAAAALAFYLFLPKADSGPPPAKSAFSIPFKVDAVAPMRFGASGQGVGVLGHF